MSKEEIIKTIKTFDILLEIDREKSDEHIPNTKLLKDLRNWWAELLLREYGVSYARSRLPR